MSTEWTVLNRKRYIFSIFLSRLPVAWYGIAVAWLLLQTVNSFEHIAAFLMLGLQSDCTGYDSLYV